MRAVRYLGRSKGVVVERTVPEPECAPGEARVRVVRAGIAPADLMTAQGLGTEGPITMGFEFVGVVEEIGPAAEGAGRAADRVRTLLGKRVVGSKTLACGQCDLCRRGLSIHCREQMVVGVRGRDGCFADSVCLPVRNLHEVPDSVDDDCAVFAEAVAAAVHAAHQIHLEGKTFVTVLGDGVVALLCAQVMQKMNASVRVIGENADRLTLCDKWGIKSRNVEDIGLRADQDAVIDCTGTPRGFERALQLVRPRGTVLVKKPYTKAQAGARPLGMVAIVRDEIEVIGSRSGPLPEALEHLRAQRVDVAPLITRRMKLDRGDEALEVAAHEDQLKVLMDV